MAKRVTRKKSNENIVDMSDRFERVLSKLVIQWANCDTWLMRVMALLFRIDLGRADLIYSSFTSSRARGEMVDRAAIMCLAHARDVKHLQKLLREFKRVTATRNTFCHASYWVGANGNAVVTYQESNYRRDNFDGTNAVEIRPIDGDTINQVRQAWFKARSLSNRFQRFVQTKPARVLELPRDQPLPLHKIQKSLSRLRRQQRGA
jgi:hypothetical protein